MAAVTGRAEIMDAPGPGGPGGIFSLLAPYTSASNAKVSFLHSESRKCGDDWDVGWDA